MPGSKAHLAALPTALKQDYQRLRALFQRKRRAWAMRANSVFDSECQERGQRCLWRDMRKGVSRGVSDLCVAGRHLGHLFDKFAGPGVPAGAPQQQDVPTAAEAESVINEVTVTLAFKRLHKQAAVGIPG